MDIPETLSPKNEALKHVGVAVTCVLVLGLFAYVHRIESGFGASLVTSYEMQDQLRILFLATFVFLGLASQLVLAWRWYGIYLDRRRSGQKPSVSVNSEEYRTERTAGKVVLYLLLFVIFGSLVGSLFEKKNDQNQMNSTFQEIEERAVGRIKKLGPTTAPSQRKRTGQNDTIEREDQTQPTPDAEPKDVGEEQMTEPPGDAD